MVVICVTAHQSEATAGKQNKKRRHRRLRRSGFAGQSEITLDEYSKWMNRKMPFSLQPPGRPPCFRGKSEVSDLLRARLTGREAGEACANGIVICPFLAARKPRTRQLRASAKVHFCAALFAGEHVAHIIAVLDYPALGDGRSGVSFMKKETILLLLSLHLLCYIFLAKMMSFACIPWKKWYIFNQCAL